MRFQCQSNYSPLKVKHTFKSLDSSESFRLFCTSWDLSHIMRGQMLDRNESTCSKVRTQHFHLDHISLDHTDITIVRETQANASHSQLLPAAEARDWICNANLLKGLDLHPACDGAPRESQYGFPGISERDAWLQIPSLSPNFKIYLPFYSCWFFFISFWECPPNLWKFSFHHLWSKNHVELSFICLTKN